MLVYYSLQVCALKQHHSYPPLYPLVTTIFLSVFFMTFWVPLISDIIQYLPSSVSLISLSLRCLRVIHVVTNVRIYSFLWLNHTSMYVVHIFSILLSIVGHLGGNNQFFLKAAIHPWKNSDVKQSHEFLQCSNSLPPLFNSEGFPGNMKFSWKLCLSLKKI